MLATGASHSYFGHDEWAEVAPGLKRIEDATRIRRRILIAFERAEIASDESERRRLLTFAIVGAGATGVEMAGAIAEIARQTLASDFRRIDPKTSRIVLIEAGPRIMPAFPEKLADYARRTLEKKGVEVMTQARVVGCDAGGVALEHGRIDAGTIIWAAGVVASPAARWLEAEADRAGRVRVGADLSLPGHPDIFVIGDTATVDEPTRDSRHRAGGQADGPLCRRADRGARERPGAAAAVSLPPSRRSRHHRPPRRRGEARPAGAHRLPRLAVLEHGAHLFPDRDQGPLRGGVHLAVGLPHLPARRAADHRGAAPHRG